MSAGLSPPESSTAFRPYKHAARAGNPGPTPCSSRCALISGIAAPPPQRRASLSNRCWSWCRRGGVVQTAKQPGVGCTEETPRDGTGLDCGAEGPGSMAEGRGNRPNPQNLQGLLRLAVEAGSASDEPAPAEPMSEERKAWLRGALAEACRGQLDEVEQMRRCLDVLRGPEGVRERGEEEEEEEESALDLLSELCENLDNARDLMTLGGLQLCVAQRLRDPAPGVRWRAAQLLAVCCQNHPEVQFHALSLGALSPLLALVDADPCPTVRVKSLYAVSCLVREQEAALREFLSHDGFSVLMRGMQSDSEKLRVKSAFLLQSLLASHAEHRDTLVSMGMVQQLVSLLRCPPSPFHEHVLGALCCLVCDFPRGVTECRDPALGLEELLKERTVELKDREECQEELEFCERLLVSCFRSLPPEGNGMDR